MFACFSGADGAAAVPGACPGIDDCLPHMAQFAHPPYLFMASGCYHFRPQPSIQDRMPLFCQSPVQRSQVIKARPHSSSRTIGASAAPHRSCRHCRLIGMALFTKPPHLTIGIGRHLSGSQCSIACWVPLPADSREQRFQIVLPKNNLFPRTNRTAVPTHTGCNLRLPDVPFLTEPPYLAVASGQHILRCQAAVSGWIPLSSQRRIHRARSFSPGINTRLAQTGQPLPLARDLISACHSCPF